MQHHGCTLKRGPRWNHGSNVREGNLVKESRLRALFEREVVEEHFETSGETLLFGARFGKGKRERIMQSRAIVDPDYAEHREGIKRFCG